MTKNKHILSPIYIHSFFIIGILATLSIRLIIVFKHINPDYIRTFWYAGVIGYIIFFAFRFYITSKRKSLINKHDLISKVQELKELGEEDKELLGYIVSSIVKSKEHLNYIFIFASSILAIVVDLVLVYWPLD